MRAAPCPSNSIVTHWMISDFGFLEECIEAWVVTNSNNRRKRMKLEKNE